MARASQLLVDANELVSFGKATSATGDSQLDSNNDSDAEYETLYLFADGQPAGDWSHQTFTTLLYAEYLLRHVRLGEGEVDSSTE